MQILCQYSATPQKQGVKAFQYVKSTFLSNDQHPVRSFSVHIKGGITVRRSNRQLVQYEFPKCFLDS
ncbi:hypothetical protein CA11_41940 [Gimesia maris]|nr:hypothetical protein CA11_41940 [Gimesia maris]